jgi:hypothetical protein
MPVSQSKSDDNWIQETLEKSTAEEFPMTLEERRDWKKFKRRGYKDFADAYHDYLRLEKKAGSLNFSLQEFCEQKGIKYPLPK